MSYGEKINKLRQEKRITQKELSDKLYVSDKTISSWELNRTEPSLEMVIKLSEILECSPSYLLYDDKSKENVEMEIKIRLEKEEYDNLILIMNQKGKLLSEINQQDVYYKSDSFGESLNKSLRIRAIGNKNIVTYKNHNNRMYSEEYEVEIDNKNNLEKIFDSVGLRKITTVNKKRRMYSYLNKYEVSLDIVDNLGYFIEIEVKETINNYLEEYDNLLKDSKQLGLNLNNIEPRRYPQMIINRK